MVCDFSACGETEEETLRKLGEHVLSVHGIEGFSRDFYNRARAAIHPGNCTYGNTGQSTSDELAQCCEDYFDYADECCC